jgi:hypothetical protein
MESAYLGIVLWLLLAAMAGRYLIIRPTDRDDRIGALVFFIVIGLPIFILGLVLIVQPSIAWAPRLLDLSQKGSGLRLRLSPEWCSLIRGQHFNAFNEVTERGLSLCHRIAGALAFHSAGFSTPGAETAHRDDVLAYENRWPLGELLGRSYVWQH